MFIAKLFLLLCLARFTRNTQADTDRTGSADRGQTDSKKTDRQTIPP